MAVVGQVVAQTHCSSIQVEQPIELGSLQLVDDQSILTEVSDLPKKL